jgi:DNA-binding MarR family transcriptional regulator
MNCQRVRVRDVAQRYDLGASFFRLAGAMAEAEQPILAAHGLTLWEYVVLTALDGRPAESQVSLARAVGRDTTRLIGHLDALEGRGLLRREPNPADRRHRIIALTEAGKTLVGACRGDIRAMETGVLAHLDAAERDRFVEQLERLASRAAPR